MSGVSKSDAFAQLSDLEVLKLIGNSAQSDQAFNEFYRRYRRFVSSSCKSCTKEFDPTGHLANDIFQVTFVKVAINGYKFKLPDGAKVQDQSLYIKGWLSRICKNELISYTRKYPLSKENAEMDSGTQNIKEQFYNSDESTEEPKTIEAQILESAVASLSESERIIVMTYMLYYDPLTPNRHLPDEVLKKLCSDLNTNAGNIRQMKSRAMKKLKDECESKNNQ